MNMSMTENEIREEIKELKRKANIFENSGYATAGISLSFKKSVKVIEELLGELKQYREIGTVQGYERAIQCSLENYNLYKEYKSKVQDYEAIGTVEDVQEIFSLCKTLQEIVKKYSAIGTVEELKAFRSDDFTEELLNVGFAKGYNKAVDEFTERLKEKLKAMSDEPAYYHENEDYFVGICSAENVVDDIAEQLKNGTDVGKENEDIER